MDDRKMTFIKEVYDTIRKMMINEQIAVCSRYILDADREARGFWALMPMPGGLSSDLLLRRSNGRQMSGYPFLCWDQLRSEQESERFDAGLSDHALSVP